MSDYLDLSTGSVTRSATELAAAADAIGQALNQFHSALSGTENAFGSDEISGRFAADYLPLVNQAMTAIVSYTEQVRYAAGGLSTTASLLESSETTAASDLARLRTQWRPAPGP